MGGYHSREGLIDGWAVKRRVGEDISKMSGCDGRRDGPGRCGV